MAPARKRLVRGLENWPENDPKTGDREKQLNRYPSLPEGLNMNYRRPDKYNFHAIPLWAQKYIERLEKKIDEKAATIDTLRAVNDGDEETTTTIEGSPFLERETIYLPDRETVTFFGRSRGGFDVRPVRDINEDYLLINSYLGGLYVSPQSGNVVKIFSERT